MARQRMDCLDGDAREGTRLATIDNIFHLFPFVLFVFIGSQSFSILISVTICSLIFFICPEPCVIVTIRLILGGTPQSVVA